MPVPASEIERLIQESLPGAKIDVVDTAGDQNHYAVNVVAEQFRGLNRVQQQRIVNKALESILHGPGAPLHAMALQTSAPE